MKHLNISSRILALSLFTLLVYSCSDEETIEETVAQTRPNILLIIADDLGKDAMPNYSEGSLKPNTPVLSGLMSSGITFDNFWSYPVCTPTRASILTGKQGIETGVIQVGDNISTSELSLQEQINSDGSNYATAIIGKWHLSNNAQDPITMGIDYFAGIINGGVSSYTNWSLSENGVSTTSTVYTTTKLTDLAINWVDDQSKPWFLWLAYNAPHTPFHLAPQELHSQGNLANDQASIDANPLPYYLSAVEAMDTEIGRFLTSLSSEERENTVIIFIGDNGTPNQVVQNPYPQQRAKGSLFQGGINVPMFIAGNGVTRMGSRDNTLVQTTDLFATIADISGSDRSVPSSSVSFKSLLSSSFPAMTKDYLYVDGYRNNSSLGFAIRNSSYKLIQYDDGVERMFHLLSDPYETTNLLNRTLSSEEQNAKSSLENLAQQIRN